MAIKEQGSLDMGWFDGSHSRQVFQVHGADKSGKVVFRRKLRRSELARFFAELEPCLVLSP
jgi:hypothetical protein